MIQVTFQGMTFSCARAVKGVNYIRLYDANNIQTAAFEEISNFSAFTIKGGDWETGKTTQRVVAQATLDENSLDCFILDIKEKHIVEDGLVISFEAPASADGITSISINSQNYSFVNAANDFVSNSLDWFAEGAKLEIILSIANDQYTAYLLNGGSTRAVDCIIEQGTEYMMMEQYAADGSPLPAKNVGTWIYEKRASGICECWGICELGTIKPSVNWGDNHYYGEIRAIKFPTNLFAETPVLHAMISEKLGGNAFITKQHTNLQNTGRLYVITPVKYEEGIDVQINFTVKGIWKSRN